MFKKVFESYNKKELEDVFKYNTEVVKIHDVMGYVLHVTNEKLGIRFSEYLIPQCWTRCFVDEATVYANMSKERFEKVVTDRIIEYMNEKKIKDEKEEHVQSVIDKLTRSGNITIKLEEVSYDK